MLLSKDILRLLSPLFFLHQPQFKRLSFERWTPVPPPPPPREEEARAHFPNRAASNQAYKILSQHCLQLLLIRMTVIPRRNWENWSLDCCFGGGDTVGVNRQPRPQGVAKKPWGRGLVNRVYYRKCLSLYSLFPLLPGQFSYLCWRFGFSVLVICTLDARGELESKCVPPTFDILKFKHDSLGFRDKISNFSQLDCFAIPRRDLSTKKTKPNIGK